MPLIPGVRFGPYEVIDLLGTGGMGEVYRARDTRLERQVAIKVLPERFTLDPGRTARFEREAKLLAQLNHPNIAQIFGLEGEGNTRGLVMELVDGPTLAERMAGRDLKIEEAVSVARQMADALEEAHEKGIVHRDLKPQNLKVTPGGRLKVLDFGLAKALDSRVELGLMTTITREMTESGAIVGTPAYMSPEQARGGEVDRRADIWAFGVILYEMLSGTRLFSEPTFAETLAAVLHKDIDLDRPLAEASDSLRTLVRRCLERDPKRRLRDIGEARVTLENLAPLPAGVATPSGTRQLPSVAVLPFSSLSTDPENEYFVDGITEDVIAHLAKVKSLSVISRTSVMKLKQAEKSLEEIAATLGVQTLLEGSVRRSGKRVRIVAQLVDPKSGKNLWADTYDRQLDDIFAIQTDVALNIASALRAELTADEHARIGQPPTRDLEAYQLYLQGRHQHMTYNREGFSQSITFFERALTLDPGFVPALTGMGHAYAELGISGFIGLVPLECFAKAQEAIDRALSLDNRLGEAHGIKGLLLFVRDFNWKGAEAEFRLALELSPGSVDIHDHFGWLCSAQARFDEAIAHVRRAREIDPLTVRSDLANELLRAGRLKEALVEAKRAVDVDPEFPRTHTIYGWCCLAVGRTEEGIASLERAVAVSEGAPLFRAQLGQAYGMTGNETKAKAILEEFKAVAAREYVAPYLFAYLHTGLGEHELALDSLELAFEQRSAGMYGMKGSYLLAPLRSHPRFQALLRRMNL